MNTEELADALVESTSRALMDGAFMMAFGTEDVGALPEPTLEVGVEMVTAGRPSYRIGLSVPAELARQITMDTLGETDPGAVSEEDVSAGILELANVVAGGFAKVAVPEGSLCTIRPPKILEEAPKEGVARLLAMDNGAFLRVVLSEAQ